MLFYLGMAYVIVGSICSVFAVAACIVHSRSARNAPPMPTVHQRYQSMRAVRQSPASRNSADADNTLVVRPA